MIETRLEWNGPQVEAEIRRTAGEAIVRATVYLWQQCRQAVGEPNSGERRKHRTKKTKSGRPASYTVYPHPSREGDPPRKRTGWLQNNIVYEVIGTVGSPVGRVGVRENAIYGAYLELGTRRMKPRPWLLATARKYFIQLQAIVTGG